MSNRGLIITRMMQVFLDSLISLQRIAKEDPEIWEQVKDDFNRAKDAFNED